MSKYESGWQFTEQYPVESDIQVKARRLSLEVGVEPVSRSIAAHLAAFPVMVGAQAILEVGTGVGVSGLALCRYVPEAHLTSLDTEDELLTSARKLFQEQGIRAAQFRLIHGDARKVLPRFNHNSYDLVHLDGAPQQLLEYLELSIPLVRPGGVIIIPHALGSGRVADPAARDEVTTAMRDLLKSVASSQEFLPSLSPVGDGLLTLIRMNDVSAEL